MTRFVRPALLATSRAALLTVVAAAIALPAPPAKAAGAGPSTDVAPQTSIRVVAVMTHRTWPAAFTFGRHGVLYFANRLTGQIRYRDGKGVFHTVFTVPNVVKNGEQGLLGLALDPNWPTTPYMYAYATRNIGGTLRNQILRITVADMVGTSFTVIFSSPTVAGQYHDGGRIEFGPDGKLYAIVGDAHVDANAQDMTTAAGKLLRMNADGSAPGDNPLGGIYFARGIRNSFGFAFDPDTGNFWETENGPDCNDELNQFASGANGGWGASENCDGTSPGDTNNSGPTPRTGPLRWWTPTIAPTGITFCPKAGCGLPGHAGQLFFGSYNQHDIRAVTLTSNRLGVSSIGVVVTRTFGILSMERNPVNQHLYFSTQTGIYELVGA